MRPCYHGPRGHLQLRVLYLGGGLAGQFVLEQPAGKHRGPEQHHPAHGVARQRIADAHGVGSNQIALQLQDLGGRDSHLRQSAEARVHPVDSRRVLAAIDDLESEFSNVVSATTLASGENAPPTLDPIVGDFVFSTEDGLQSLLLTGISTGGEPGQTITLSATVDDSDFVTLGSITYTPNETSGSLAFTPAGSGEAVITVSVSDGVDTVNRSFTVFVFDPITLLNFDQEADFARFLVTQQHGDLTWDEPGQRLRFQGAGVSSDQVAVAFGRPATQSLDAGSFEIRARVRVDEIVNTATDRSEARIYLGFARDAVADDSKLQTS